MKHTIEDYFDSTTTNLPYEHHFVDFAPTDEERRLFVDTVTDDHPRAQDYKENNG